MQRLSEAGIAMGSHVLQKSIELTSDLLLNLLSQLGEEGGGDQQLIKRGCGRWTLRAPAELYFRRADGTEVGEYVSIRDISLTGVGLTCKKPVEAGIAADLVLPLEDGYYKVRVMVVHCTQTIGGYKVGANLLLPDARTEGPAISRALLTKEEFEQGVA
jgi:hypothetical protein